LRTGITLSRLELDSDDGNKRARNRANARKAYNAALRQSEKLFLTPAQSAEIGAKFNRLKANLEKLGGVF
jgi:hypothetical protein